MAFNSTSDGTGAPVKRRCRLCSPPVLIPFVVLLAAIGGVLLWHLLPQQQKNSIKSLVTGSAGVVAGSVSAQSQPSINYTFIQVRQNCDRKAAPARPYP